MKPLGYCALILTMAVVAVAASAEAQEPKNLSLPAALDMASRQNLDLLAARARRAVAQAGVQVAKQIPNPTASVAVLRDTPHESLFFDQQLEIGGRRRRRIEVARQEGGLTEVDIATLTRQVRRNVREAFYNLALARGTSSQRGQALKLAERLQEIARSRFEAGDVPQLEVIQAELGVSRSRADFQVAQQEEKVALSGLNALLNVPATTDWQLEGPLDSLPPPIPLPELVDRATASNSELQRVAQEQKVEKSRQSLFEAERIPNLGLEFGTDFNAPHDFRVGPRGQITVELPIFTRNQGQIAQSLASQRVLSSEVEAIRRSVAGRVESAYFEFDARRAEVEVYHRDLVPATQRLEDMAEESYRAGKSSIFTVLDAQRNIQQVQQEYLQSLFNAQSSFARLEETVGVPLD